MTPLDLKGKICGKQLDDLENLVTTVGNQHGESQVKQFLANLHEPVELHETRTQHSQQSYNFRYQGLAFRFTPAFYETSCISIMFLVLYNHYQGHYRLDTRYLQRDLVAQPGKEAISILTPDEELVGYMRDYNFTIDVNDFDKSLANWFKAWASWLKANSSSQILNNNHKEWETLVNHK